MRSIKFKYTLSNIPIELYLEIIKYCDIKSLLTLNCVNKDLNKNFKRIAFKFSKTKFFNYSARDSFSTTYHSAILVQTINNNDAKQVIELLDSGIVLPLEVVNLIRTNFNNLSDVWKPLISQVQLWDKNEDLSYHKDQTKFYDQVSSFLIAGASLNSRTYNGLTFIELLVSSDILCLLNMVYNNKFYTEIIQPAVESAKKLISNDLKKGIIKIV